MKKIPALLLLLIFMLTNSNLVLSMHWCGGKLASVVVSGDTHHLCKCGQKKMKPFCCKDKSVKFKANEELSKLNTQFTIKISDVTDLFIITKIYLLSAQPNDVKTFYFYGLHPPNKIKWPIFLLDNSFLI